MREGGRSFSDRSSHDQPAVTLRSYRAGMADLDTNARKHIKDSNFGLPDERKYPIEDIDHARNALARVAQHGTKAEQEEVRRNVERKYPSLKHD